MTKIDFLIIKLGCKMMDIDEQTFRKMCASLLVWGEKGSERLTLDQGGIPTSAPEANILRKIIHAIGRYVFPHLYPSKQKIVELALDIFQQKARKAISKTDTQFRSALQKLKCIVEPDSQTHALLGAVERILVEKFVEQYVGDSDELVSIKRVVGAAVRGQSDLHKMIEALKPYFIKHPKAFIALLNNVVKKDQSIQASEKETVYAQFSFILDAILKNSLQEKEIYKQLATNFQLLLPEITKLETKTNIEESLEELGLKSTIQDRLVDLFPALAGHQAGEFHAVIKQIKDLDTLLLHLKPQFISHPDAFLNMVEEIAASDQPVTDSVCQQLNLILEGILRSSFQDTATSDRTYRAFDILLEKTSDKEVKQAIQASLSELKIRREVRSLLTSLSIEADVEAQLELKGKLIDLFSDHPEAILSARQFVISCPTQVSDRTIAFLKQDQLEVLIFLGEHYTHTQPEKALHYFERAAKEGSGWAAYQAGSFYLEQGKKALAASYFIQAWEPESAYRYELVYKLLRIDRFKTIPEELRQRAKKVVGSQDFLDCVTKWDTYRCHCLRADLGIEEAHIDKAICLKNGRGGAELNQAEARQLIESLEKSLSPEVQFRLGRLMEAGDPFIVDIPRACHHYLEAALMGSQPAVEVLLLKHAQLQKWVRNSQETLLKARDFYLSRARDGNIQAMSFMINTYGSTYKTIFNYPEDLSASWRKLETMHKAVAIAQKKNLEQINTPDVQAFCDLGQLYAGGNDSVGFVKNLNKASSYLKKAASWGNLTAVQELLKLEDTAISAALKDKLRHFEGLLISAKSDPKSQYEVGKYLLRGDKELGFKPNVNAATHFFKLAKDQDHLPTLRLIAKHKKLENTSLNHRHLLQKIEFLTTIQRLKKTFDLNEVLKAFDDLFDAEFEEEDYAASQRLVEYMLGIKKLPPKKRKQIQERLAVKNKKFLSPRAKREAEDVSAYERLKDSFRDIYNRLNAKIYPVLVKK
jgi:TPR repeat protein